MRRFLIPLLAANSLLALASGALFLGRERVRILSNIGDLPSRLFVASLLLSVPLGLFVAIFGPRRPEGLLRLDSPDDAGACARAKFRMKALLRIVGAGFVLGLLITLGGNVTRRSSEAGGMLLACAVSLMILAAPWIALYARWFRIDWF